MRGSVADDRNRNTNRAKDKMTVNQPLNSRREFGQLMNYNAKPLYMNGPVQPPAYQRGNPTIWNSRLNENLPQQNPFYRHQHDAAYNSLSGARQISMGINDIYKSQVVAAHSRQPSLSRQKKVYQSRIVSTKKQQVSSLTNSLMVSPNAKKFEQQNIRGSTVCGPAKIPQPQNTSSFRFQFTHKTKKGFIPNVNKENQDICIINPNINNRPWEHFFAVCDGHGQTGHLISNFIRTHFLTYMTKNQDFHKKPQENLYMAFRSTIEGLMKESYDIAGSGSTMVSCYMYKQKLFCGNVGDSRVIIGSKNLNTGKWTAKQLSNDHKPCLASEAQRIWRCNGRIEPMKDNKGCPAGPLRVWLQNQQLPGLAMTRSLGDLMAAQVGVTWQPQITEHVITPNDKIMVIASDGVWEFLQNDDVIAKLSPYYESNQLEEASKFLMEYSTAAWNSSMSMVDDISFVILFFHHD